MVNRKELDPDNPEMAFGLQLRQARDVRGWTQDELAARMGCSGTHVSAVETGRRSPTARFARSADRALGTGDKFQLMVHAINNTALLEGFPEFVRLEIRAAEIRLFELGIIPGLLQTAEYAAAISHGAVRRGAITEQQAEERLSLLAERQASLTREPPPMIYAVLDESCIRQAVGGPAVMEAQLDKLVAFAELPCTVLQIAPFELGERRAFDQPVTLLTLPDRTQVAYSESAHQGRLERDTHFVQPFMTAYHQMQAEAASQAESVTKISKLRKGVL
ncbi:MULTISPECIES: helix-turn-helix domain-containing protein [unclassified Streptomyces]|uniref:helix-turn-helix domain-containing protein n=1 Tax=unclassified Streptomyces TaxID=2593676 RepID=UPI00081F595C|nr:MULTISPECIES: helix-turn-helix transcriptional regulator [unclassified Streptomyces]MYR95560.1 helix-turn-helix domain-containing protein [Streptomyces sp. SID4937]SCD92805.1 Helix-turn-helix domain-containing protein [Streptomyces sp. ScaeMP-e83]